MRTKNMRATVPRISLRVPGPWKVTSELADRLPAGFRIEGDSYVLPDGERLAFEAMRADTQFPGIFRGACRRRPPNPHELRGLDNYGMNAAVTGPGGSLAAAQVILHAGAGLVGAGGFGVFIDNSAMAHGGSDWLELTEHRQDVDALFYTFVNFVKSREYLASHGMHAFGQRDGTVPHGGDLETVVVSLEDFLRSICADRLRLTQDKIFTDTQGRCYRLHGEPDRSPFRNHPINNPYGRWRLEPVT